jgi:hypothetical protein
MLGTPTSVTYNYVTFHQQRSDAFTTLSNGLRCGILFDGTRAIFLAGEKKYNILSILSSCTCLGVRAMSNWVVCLTNPLLIIVLKDLGVSVPAEPLEHPGNARLVLFDANGAKETMINAVKQFYEGQDRSLFAATNSGQLALIRLRPHAVTNHHIIKTIRRNSTALNDVDARFCEVNGLVYLVTVGDTPTITLHLVNLHADAAKEDFDGQHDISESSAAVSERVLSTYSHPGLTGFFAYCAFSCCGRYVAATADQGQMIVVCEVSEHIDSLALSCSFATPNKPLRVIPVANSKFAVLCFRDIIIVDPATKTKVVLPSSVAVPYVGISDTSLTKFTSVLAGQGQQGRSAFQQELEVVEDCCRANPLPSIYGSPSSLRCIATQWIREACTTSSTSPAG